jgi:hypothetical protein
LFIGSPPFSFEKDFNFKISRIGSFERMPGKAPKGNLNPPGAFALPFSGNPFSYFLPEG